jgi:hypothetical protein
MHTGSGRPSWRTSWHVVRPGPGFALLVVGRIVVNSSRDVTDPLTKRRDSGDTPHMRSWCTRVPARRARVSWRTS